jgi:hypothetical protein
MKKLLLIILILNLNLFAGNSPLKIKYYTEKRGFYTYTAFKPRVIVDKIFISKVTVNRGKCQLYWVDWVLWDRERIKVKKDDGNINRTYKYGDKLLTIHTRCDPIEITFETDQGTYSWEL